MDSPAVPGGEDFPAATVQSSRSCYRTPQRIPVMTVLLRHGQVNSNHGPAHSHVWRHKPKEQLAFKTLPESVLPTFPAGRRIACIEKEFHCQIKNTPFSSHRRTAIAWTLWSGSASLRALDALVTFTCRSRVQKLPKLTIL